MNEIMTKVFVEQPRLNFVCKSNIANIVLTKVVLLIVARNTLKSCVQLTSSCCPIPVFLNKHHKCVIVRGSRLKKKIMFNDVF